VFDEIQVCARLHCVSEDNIMIDAGHPAFDPRRGEHGCLLSLLGDRVQGYRVEP
jgi:hypothetical protein